MAQQPALLIDDQNSQIGYSCTSFRQTGAKSSYLGTYTTTEGAGDGCSKEWFNYTFFGSGIHVEAFILSPMTYSVRIDDGPFVKQAGHGSFYSPSLPDGEHSIAYALPTSGQALPLFDYIAVTPGANTPLAGKVLAVDDTDPSISYAGNWGTFLPFNATANLFPPLYRGSAHWSSTIGDSLHFQFEGSMITVYGSASDVNAFNITTSYTLDGVTTTTGLPPDTNNADTYLILFQANVEPGLHTLVIDMLELLPSQALGIDLITYTPSFNTISEMPNAAGNSPQTTAVARPMKFLNVGSKVGIAFGVLAFVTFTVIAIFLFLKERYRIFTRPRNRKFRLYDSFEYGDRKLSFPLQPTT